MNIRPCIRRQEDTPKDLSQNTIIIIDTVKTSNLTFENCSSYVLFERLLARNIPGPYLKSFCHLRLRRSWSQSCKIHFTKIKIKNFGGVGINYAMNTAERQKKEHAEAE
jgi:hypothetical protein